MITHDTMMETKALKTAETRWLNSGSTHPEIEKLGRSARCARPSSDQAKSTLVHFLLSSHLRECFRLIRGRYHQIISTLASISFLLQHESL